MVGAKLILHPGNITNLAKKSSINSPDIKGAVIIIEELAARKKLMQSWLFINLDELKLLFQLFNQLYTYAKNTQYFFVSLTSSVAGYITTSLLLL